MLRPFIFLSFLFLSCNAKEENEAGFTRSKTNFQYKIISGENGDSIRFGDIVKVHLKQFIDDSLMNDTRLSVPLYVRIDKNLRDFDFSTIIPKMKVGDSGVCIFPTKEIIDRSTTQHPPHFLEDGKNIRVYFRIIKRFASDSIAMSDHESETLLADSLKSINDRAGLLQSSVSFDSLIKRIQGNYLRLSNGVVIQHIEKGGGRKIIKGDSVAVIYKGMLMNGTVFEQTSISNPFLLKAGAGDAIAGFDSAIARLTFRDKARIYIPAKQAYAQNKQGGKIPAYSNLIFEVEVREVNK